MNDVKTILLTTDLSETAARAVGPATTLARRLGAKIVLAHVVETYPMEVTALDFTDALRRLAATAQRELARLATTAPFRGIEVEICVSSGKPWVEIVRLAEERGAEVIVMAMHGRGFVSRVVMGSVTEKVLRHAPCPVLVLPDAPSTSARGVERRAAS